MAAAMPRAARPLEPAFVLRTLEGLQERVPGAGSSVTERGSFLHSGRSRVPGKLRACEQQVVVEVIARGRDDTRCAGAELHSNRAVG